MEEPIAIDWTLGDIVKLYFVNIDFKSCKNAKEYPEGYSLLGIYEWSQITALKKRIGEFRVVKLMKHKSWTNDNLIHGDLSQVATVLSFMQSVLIGARERVWDFTPWLYDVFYEKYKRTFLLASGELEGLFFNRDGKVVDDAVETISSQHELGFVGTYCPFTSLIDMGDALLHHLNHEMIYTTELRIDDLGVQFMRVWFQCGVTQDDALALFNDTSPARYCEPRGNHNNRVKSCKAYKCECHNKRASTVQKRQSIQMECPSTVQLCISHKRDIIYADITGHNHEWSYAIDAQQPIDRDLITYIKERSKALTISIGDRTRAQNFKFYIELRQHACELYLQKYNAVLDQTVPGPFCLTSARIRQTLRDHSNENRFVNDVAETLKFLKRISSDPAKQATCHFRFARSTPDGPCNITCLKYNFPETFLDVECESSGYSLAYLPLLKSILTKYSLTISPKVQSIAIASSIVPLIPRKHIYHL